MGNTSSAQGSVSSYPSVPSVVFGFDDIQREGLFGMYVNLP